MENCLIFLLLAILNILKCHGTEKIETKTEKKKKSYNCPNVNWYTKQRRQRKKNLNNEQSNQIVDYVNYAQCVY